MIEGKKILITGGAGFIGSNLIEKFLLQGNFVVCLDNFSTGKRCNLAQWMKHPNFTLIEGDICDFEVCKKAVEGVDFVSHQAALGSVPRSVKDPVSTVAVNVSGFVNVLFAAQQAGVKRLIYASSSSVYGDAPNMPMVENVIGRQLSPYAVSKRTDELFAENIASLYNMEIIGLRYFNVFGRRQSSDSDYAAVIPRFIYAFLKHESPQICGDGTQSRDFTPVDNVLLANELAMETNRPEAVNTVYNVACGGAITVSELFLRLRAEVARKDSTAASIQAVHVPPRPGEILHSFSDISKARDLLNYTPEVSVETALRETVDWYYAQYNCSCC